MLEREDNNQGTAQQTLSEKCRLVRGAKRAAIYDLKDEKVYSLNEDALRVVDGLEDDGDFWEKLRNLGLTATSEFSEKIELKIPQVGLEFMWLELTDKCNQRCVHCYAESGQAMNEIERPVTFWEKVMEQGRDLSCDSLQFIGGEPTLFNGLLDLANTARTLGYHNIEIFSNGTLWRDKDIQIVKDLGIKMAISLYSINPDVHDSITTIQGSFQKTMRTLERLKEAQIPIRIGLILMKQNQSTIFETRQRLHEMGMGRTRPDVVRPTGRGCYDLLPDEEIIKSFALVTRPDFSVNDKQFIRNQHWNSCWAGKIAISPNGDIMPCVFARNHVVANATTGLKEAVESELLQNLWKITKERIKTCQDCEYRYACHDCRPLAESINGNLFDSNPRCTYNPKKGEWLEKGGEYINA